VDNAAVKNFAWFKASRQTDKESDRIFLQHHALTCSKPLSFQETSASQNRFPIHWNSNTCAKIKNSLL
jgi:hypothetical protein